MRIIDADKLPYEDIESVDGNTYMCVNAYDIEHAPTIEQSEDCISREKAIKQCGFGMTSLLIADCLRRLPPVTPSYNSIKTELKPCEDCISREEAIRIAEQGQIQGYEWQFKKLCNLPSVTPLRPIGKWIPVHPLQEDDDGAYICSNCEHGDWDCDTNYKYCPFCGADMRESEG